MNKKLLAKFLSGCILAGSMLAGCGTGAGQTASSGASGVSKEVTSSEVTQEASTGTLPENPSTAPNGANAQTFSKNLFAKSMAETNPVLSPVSAYLAMSLAGAGAKGDTAKEFENVMGADFQAMSEKLMETLPADAEGMQVLLANSAWLDDRMNCEADWMNVASDNYRAGVYQMRLSTPEAKDGMNKWIEDNTKGLIRNFLNEPLDDETRLALFNTLYFKGKWEQPFDALDTADRTFTLADGTQITTPMMRKYDEEVSYVKGAGCDGVVLPYEDSDLKFVALKPTEGQNVRQMYQALDLEQIGVMADQAEKVKVDLKLPKFKVTFDRILNDDMIEMGFEKAFDGSLADFTGIGLTSEGLPLYISLVRQKSVFIADEEGTEAAAVTMVAMDENAMAIREEPLEVYFDEPFLYMILDPGTNLPLFIGIMDDPSAVQE